MGAISHSRSLRAALAAVFIGLGTASIQPVFSAETRPVLDMFEQLAHEKHALRIVEMPQVQEQKKRVAEMYRGNWLAETPDGAARLENAVNTFALFAAQLALIDDPARPKIVWANMLAHEWHGVKWPDANWGIDNPDNMYRYLLVDGVSRYEISGQMNGPGPVQQSYILYSSIPGTTEDNIEGAPIIGALASEDLVVAPDGSFMITVGPEAAESGKNHIQTKPNAKAIFIRDTMGDWATQFPNRLRVQRVAGPPAAAPRTDDEIAALAADYLRLETSYWLKYFDERNYKNPRNTIPPVVGRSGKWGLLATNWFKLAKDEVFIVTLDPVGAAYVEFQIGDPWSITPDYVNQTAGLNNFQMKANADGTYTFVIAPEDPGVWNWVDADGMHLGLFTVRWQNLSEANPPLEKTVRETKVVKIANLKGALPPETVWVTPEQRKAQLAERVASYQKRLAN